MSAKKGSTLGATLLVTGTTIGGGILALPVATGVSGFFPSLFMMLLGWGFMTMTALYLAEVSLWMEEGAHVISMASRFLGPLGKGTAWLLYLFISYASLVAYAAGGGDLLAAASERFFGFQLGEAAGTILFVLLFCLVIYLGNLIVGRINTLFMGGLVFSYLLLIGLGYQHIAWENLLHRSWGHALIAVPLLLTIFSFQTIVPSLTFYLKKDGKALRRAIIFGTTGALVIYLIWQCLVLGSVLVDGDEGLAKALADGKAATHFLGVATQSAWLGMVADFFAFFAITTSFLGIALGLFDFLSDGLRIPREGWGGVTLGLLIAVPTLIFALTMERVFLRALDVTGGIGDSLLNGLIPALMIWVGRYRHQLTSEYRTFGGKPLLVLIMLYALFVFTLEILGQVGLFATL